MSVSTLRLEKELKKLMSKPPPGITCYPLNDELKNLKASIKGAHGSPYESGIFQIEINIPFNYPFCPPHFQFLTKIYHPNIDEAGRICLDVLKLQPEGTWRPTFTIEGILVAIQLLMSQPNPDHPLVATIAHECRFNRTEFERKAKEWTAKYAI